MTATDDTTTSGPTGGPTGGAAWPPDMMLPPGMPSRMSLRPRDPHGRPVPFVIPSGVGDAVNVEAAYDALRFGFCSLCGVTLPNVGKGVAFILDPAATVTHMTVLPAAHRDCAWWAVQVYPYVTHDVTDPACPVVRAVWTTTGWEAYPSERTPTGFAVRVAAPESVSWWYGGRAASRDEALAGLAAGKVAALGEARIQGAGMDTEKHIEARARDTARWLPPA